MLCFKIEKETLKKLNKTSITMEIGQSSETHLCM